MPERLPRAMDPGDLKKLLSVIEGQPRPGDDPGVAENGDAHRGAAPDEA